MKHRRKLSEQLGALRHKLTELVKAGEGAQAHTETVAETALEQKQREDHFQVLAESLSEVIWVENAETLEMLYVSPAYDRLWGRSRAELYADSEAWLRAIHPDDRGRVEQRFNELAASGQYDEEFRVVLPDGTVRWIRDRSFKLETKPGRPKRLAGIARDITDLKQADDRSLATQQLVLLHLAMRLESAEPDIRPMLQQITEAAAGCLDTERVSIWSFNLDHSILGCLDLYQRSEGKHSDGLELTARDYPSYFSALLEERAIAADDAHTDPRTREFSESYLRPLGIVSMLDAPVRVGGRLYGVVCHEHVGTTRLWSQIDQSFAASIADLVAAAVAESERRQEEQERHALEAKLTQAQKLESLGVLAGGIAHDFNNLLQGILSNAELAGRELGVGSEARDRLDGVRKAARRAAALCDEMLAYSGQGEFVIEPVHLGDVVHEIAHLLEASISKKCLVEYDLDQSLPLVEADRTQMQQVIMNLITNASEAIGDAEGTIFIRGGCQTCTQADLSSPYLHEVLPAGRYVFLEVEDTGCGMDSVTLDRLFDPFFTTKFTGRGLGLAALLGIVRGHKGVVQVNSEPGRGTRFRLLFPVLDSPPAVVPDGSVPSKAEPQIHGTVLLVDDEEIVRLAVKAMLETIGFDVLVANDGRQAVEIFGQHGDQITCVLLDLLMPHMDGEQTLHELRRIRPDLPVIISSGFSETKVASRFADQAGLTVIKKPFESDLLLTRLEEVLPKSSP